MATEPSRTIQIDTSHPGLQTYTALLQVFEQALVRFPPLPEDENGQDGIAEGQSSSRKTAKSRSRGSKRGAEVLDSHPPTSQAADQVIDDVLQPSKRLSMARDLSTRSSADSTSELLDKAAEGIPRTLFDAFGNT